MWLVCTTAFNFFRIFEEDYDTLEPLVVLDPLLLPLLVNVCCPEDLPVVFSVIPPYLSAARIVKLVKDGGHIYSEQVLCP